MRIKEVKTFTKGTINSIEDHSIPDGASSDSKNWLTKGDKIELRKGYKVLGTEQSGTGSIDGLHVTFKANGTQVLFRKRGRKLEYYDTTPSLLDQQQTDVDYGTGSRFADTTKQKAAQTFKPSVTGQITNFQVQLTKAGSPTDFVRLQIYANNAGSPGTLLGTSEVTISGASLSTSTFATCDFTFANGPTLTAETTYWAVLSRTSTLDDTNYYRYGYGGNTGVDRYSRGESFYYDGAAWTTNDGSGFTYDAYFKTFYEGTNDWAEVSSDIFPVAAVSDEASFANYASLAGNQMFVCTPNSGPYKIMTANPGSYTDLTDAAKNFQGYIKIKQNRMFLWNRIKDKTGIYGSYIDAAAYTTVTAETIGSGDGVTTSFTGVLAFKAAGATRTCFAVSIFESGGSAETFTDDYNGNLTGSAGGTGTIDYTTGRFFVTFAVAPDNTSNNLKATYQWENSNNTGITDFTKSATRTAGQGFVFRQDDGGGDTKNVSSYGDVEYCFHRLKSWALTLTATDTNATNLIYRDNVGIPNWRAAVATGDGVYFIDDYDQTDPKFRLLTLNNISTQVIPVPVSNALNLEDYRFDKGVSEENGDLIIFECRHKDSTENDTTFVYDKRYKSFDRLDYAFSCAAKYNGALVVGDSISDNVFELFSGFDDNGSLISNYWEGNLSDLGIKALKKVRRFWIEGEISRDQSLDIFIATDNGSYINVGTQNGTDSNVDSKPRTIIGSDTIGQATLGGQTSINIYHYIKEIKLQNGKFLNRKVKYKANGIGYVSVSTQTDYDIILNQQKLPQKYRA